MTDMFGFDSEMSIFRFLVGILAFGFFFVILNLLRNRKIIGSEFLIWVSIIFSIIYLCIFPQTIEYIFNYINLSSKNRYDRLIQLGYLFSFVSLGIIFYYRNKIHTHREQFIQSIQELIQRKFVKKNMDMVGKIDLMILIPAFNEEDNISKVIKRIPKKICGYLPYIIVVSDGSDDLTFDEASKSGAKVIQHPVNFGQCVAYRTGYSIANKMKVKYLVHLDADGQYQPEEIERLLMPLINEESDLVSGSRQMGIYEEKFKISNLPRSFGVSFFNYLLTFLLGLKITDSSSGFRAIKAKFLPMLTLKQEQFHSSELLIESIKKGARFKEVPISFLGRISGKSKKPNSIKYAFGFLNAIIRTWLRN